MDRPDFQGNWLECNLDECEDLLRNTGRSRPQLSKVGARMHLWMKITALSKAELDTPYIMTTEVFQRLVTIHGLRRASEGIFKYFDQLLGDLILRLISENATWKVQKFFDSDPRPKEHIMIAEPKDHELYARRVEIAERLNITSILPLGYAEGHYESLAIINGVQLPVEGSTSDCEEDTPPERAQDSSQNDSVRACSGPIDPTRQALVNDLERQVESLTKAKEELQASLTTKEKQLRSNKSGTKRLNKENTALRKKVAMLEAFPVEGSTTSVKDHPKETRKLRDEIDTLKSALADQAENTFRDDEFDRLEMEVSKAKESVEEAHEDLLYMEKMKKTLVQDNAALEGCLTVCLQKSTERDDRNQELEGIVAELEDVVVVGMASRELLLKQKENAISVNTRISSSLTEANTYSAALVKANEQLNVDCAKRDAEFKCVQELLSASEGQRACLKARLEEISQALDQTNISMAADMQNLTAENLRLEQELRKANDLVGEARAMHLPRSRSHSTANDFSDTDTDDFIDLTEASDWHNGVPINL